MNIKKVTASFLGVFGLLMSGLVIAGNTLPRSMQVFQALFR